MSFPLISDAAGDPDSPIRAVVTPSQSAYFAGETLSVTITFTNTRTYSPEGEAGPSSRADALPRSSRTHKRASHSVSSAPIARPPTSSAGLYRPRTPTTAAVPGSPAPSRQTSLGQESDTRIKRRGLIGKRLGAEGKDKAVPDLVEQRRMKMSSKSLSLNLGFCQDESEIATGLNDNEELAKPTSQMQRSLTADAHLLLSSPKIPSPLARSETLPLSSKHPHARKQSLMDGTQLPYSPPSIYGSDTSTSPTSLISATSTTSTANTLISAPASTDPSTPSASTSSFSLALDPISETSPVHPYLSPSVPATASASGLGPALSSPSISVEAPSPPSASIRQHSYPPFSSSKPTSTRQLHRPPNLGIGKPSSRMFLNLSETKAELILYSYAQLKGTVTLTPIPSNTVPVSSSNRAFPQSPLSPSHSTPHLSPVLPAPLSAAQIEQQKAQTLAALRQVLLKGSATAVGGGSMDITSRTHSRTPSVSGTASLGGGLGSGSWGSFGGNASAGVVSAYGPLSAKPSLGTINSGSTEGPSSPTSASVRRSHSRASSFSSGLLSIFGSPFGLGGSSGPVSAPPVTRLSNLAASASVPNVANSYGEQPQQQVPLPARNRTASASVVPSVSSGWPSVASPANQQAPVSAGLDQPASFTSFSALSSPGLGPGSGSRLGLGLGWSFGLGQSTEEVDPELPLPTFEAQSTMLAVDMCLEPGESKSYQYSILLPANLPPTFRGRTLRFAYELVVGICRAGPSNNFVPSEKGSGPGGSVSKVMKVPIRVYTNVVVGRPPTPYDLLWPVNKRRSTLVLGHRRGGRLSSSAKESSDKDDPYVGRVVEIEPSSLVKSPQNKLPTLISSSDSYSSLSGRTQASGSLNELKEYAKRLVAELPEPSQPGFEVPSSPEPSDVSVSSTERPLSTLFEEDAGEEIRKTNGHGNGHTESPVHVLAFKEKERIAKMRQREESDDPIPVGGCGEAVEILTRNPKKVSYDVNKDGVKVAVLTFIKSAFRLGETIHGVVELNERQSRARVVQLSAHLETHESLPYPISTTPNTAAAIRQLKRVYVEHHSSFVLSTLRTTFALDIPSDASPAFQIKVGDQPVHTDTITHPKTKFDGGLEWKVRLCLLVAVAKENSDSGTEGVRFKSLVRDGPRGEWGSAWKAPIGAAPSEKPISAGSSTAQLSPRQQQPGVVKSWTSFITASFLGAAEGGYHDGDELSDYSSDPNDDEVGYEGNHTSYDGIKPDRAGGVGTGVNFGGGREVSWQEVKLETVECEVPVSVWPGNTAFKPVDVVFDV
ncbi:Rgp1-domain-containing protein [Lentinula edodes]|uniref:Rgp1-domain-containing protein n=1 Tax=Lentinula lateritia TaxID=40482 RepID=A0A9W9AAS0_9AGAR|nr:Rgp1-domain-containing protein [Lentinula edodes]